MTAPCLAPGPNDPSCGYDGETGGCVHGLCRYTDEGDAEGPETHRTGAGSDSRAMSGVALSQAAAQDGHGASPADSIARLAALAEAGQGARTHKDAGVVLDVIARGLRFIETEMRQG